MEKDNVSGKTTIPLLISFMVFAGLFSIFFLSTQSLRLDEAQSLWQSSHSPVKILSIIAQDVHVPLYHLLLHGWQKIFNSAVSTGRIFSMIFFLLTIPLLYWLGKKTVGYSAAIFATFMFSISPFINWYGNEIRMYSLMTFLVVLNQIFFVRIFQSKNETPSNYIWIAYFLTSLLGIYTHYFFWLILLAEAIFFFVRRSEFPPNSFRNFTIIVISLGALIAPWLIYVKSLGSASNTKPLLDKPTTSNIFNAFSQFLFGFQNERINTILVSLWPISVVLGFLSLRKGRSSPNAALYLFLSFFVPIMVAFLLSVAFRPVFLSRYLIIVVPSLYLFLSWVITSLQNPSRKLLQIAMTIILIATLTQQTVSASTPVKENYEQAVQYLNINATPQDAIIVSAPFTIYPIEYYYRGPAKLTTLPIWDRLQFGPVPGFNETDLPNQVNTLTDTKRRVFLLLSFNQGYEEKLRIYFDTHFERLDQKVFSPGLSMYTYRIRYDPLPDFPK